MTPVLDQPTRAEIHQMSCMEVWGGNRAVDTAVSVPGIDAWVYAQPWEGAEAGGDLHYMSMCAMGRIARFVVADVSGHGQAVAEASRNLRRFMRKHINTPDQSRFTRVLNRAFSGDARGRFATAALVSYHAPSEHLIVSNAGHPRPLHYRAQSGSWSLLDRQAEGALVSRSEKPRDSRLPSNLPLGVIEPTEYHQFAMPFRRGDRIVMYTDALIEAADENGRQLGERGLLVLVDGLEHEASGEFRIALTERVNRHAGDRPDDDVTLLTLDATGNQRRTIPLRERLNAVMRMLKD